MTRRVLLLGPPGSGKGTVGRFLATLLGVPHISSGQLLRGSLQAGDPYRIASLVATGRFVPDEVVARVVDDHLGSGFVLDGYPRTAAQAEHLDTMLERDHRRLQVVIELAVRDDVAQERIALRARTEHRTDDKPKTIAGRLAIYHHDIGPLLHHYRGRVARVDATGSVHEVCERAKVAVSPRP